MIESLIVQIAGYVWEALTGVPARRQLRGTFDERVAAAAEALAQAGRTVTDLEAEIAVRREAVQRLESERKVLNVDHEQLEAVANLLNHEMRADGRRALWIGIGSNALFFVLGVIATVLLQ